MILSKKISFLCFFLFGSMVLCPDQAEILTTTSLVRVQLPTVEAVSIQKKLQSKRKMNRMLISAGVCASAVVGLYAAVCIGHAINEQKKAETQWVSAEGMVPVATTRERVAPSTLSWPASSFISALKSVTLSATDFGANFAKFLADSTTMLAAGIISNGTWQYLQRKASQAYQDETILWFVEKQTKIPSILASLKSKTAEYDLHSALLSGEMLNQDAQIHVKAFVEDVAHLAADGKYNYHMPEEAAVHDRFSYLLGEIKKKYVRKADQLESMQDQLVPLLAMQCRGKMNAESSDLFDRDKHARADIAYLCQQLVGEMSRLLAFIEIHKHRHQLRVQDLIDSCNKFLGYAEVMLGESAQEIEAASKQNRGIFTVTSEYERLFNQQVNFLDAYCRVVKV